VSPKCSDRPIAWSSKQYSVNGVGRTPALQKSARPVITIAFKQGVQDAVSRKQPFRGIWRRHHKDRFNSFRMLAAEHNSISTSAGSLPATSHRIAICRTFCTRRSLIADSLSPDKPAAVDNRQNSLSIPCLPPASIAPCELNSV